MHLIHISHRYTDRYRQKQIESEIEKDRSMIEWYREKARLQSLATEHCEQSWKCEASEQRAHLCSPFCLWLSSIQLESPYRAMRPPPSDGVWYSPRMGTPSTTAVSCFNTSKPWKESKTNLFWNCMSFFLVGNKKKKKNSNQTIIIRTITKMEMFLVYLTVKHK